MADKISRAFNWEIKIKFCQSEISILVADGFTVFESDHPLPLNKAYYGISIIYGYPERSTFVHRLE